jgi:two-component system NarL family sensor kinase
VQDKTVILIIFFICIFLVAVLAGFISWILFAYQKKQIHYLSQLETIKNNNEKELLRAQLEMQEETFQHISLEIHDNIGQFISLAKLHLNTIDTSSKEALPEKIGYAADLLTKALDDLRDLSKSLSSDLIKNAGLEKAMEMEVTQLRKIANYDIVFEVQGNYSILNDQKEIIIFRIFQEAVNNIIKHAMATRISIKLNFLKDQLSLCIADNGIGFLYDPSSSMEVHGKGEGIRNMKRRAKLIDSSLSITSEPGQGTRITIDIPYQSPAHAPTS